MREQNILAANEFIELFCELIVQRLTIIAKQRYMKVKSNKFIVYLYTMLAKPLSVLSWFVPGTAQRI